MMSLSEVQGGPCFICKREAFSGLTFQTKPVCLKCAPYSLAGAVMIQFTETEEEAIEAGGAAAGAYLETIGKFDLSELSPEQWRDFLNTVLHGYSAHMQAAAVVHPPFEGNPNNPVHPSLLR
jgi:hypothetical protein